MSSAFSKAKDQKVADAATKFNPLMCRATGCPNRWSAAKDGEQPLCSFHAWADPHLWPLITQEQIEAETDRAVAAQSPKKVDPSKHISRQGALQRLANFRFPVDGSRDWARRIIDRHENGERIPMAHPEMARRALGRCDAPSGSVMGEVKPISLDKLPPSHRPKMIDDDAAFPPPGL